MVQGDTVEKLIQTKNPFSEVKQHFEILWNKIFGNSEYIDFQEDSVRWGVRVRTKSRVPVIKYISEKNKIIYYQTLIKGY